MITQKELSLKIKRHFFNSQNNSKNSKFYLTSFAISPGFLILKIVQRTYWCIKIDKK